MPTVAYLTNQFPSPVEPYVVEEIKELRKRGVTVIPCSARHHRAGLDSELEGFAAETLYLQTLRLRLWIYAAILCVVKFPTLKPFYRRALIRKNEPFERRLRALLHTWLGVYYALLIKTSSVDHIHVHHGYFASWIAMVAARVLGIQFSMTLHGSDLLLHASYLDTKLEHCKFCVTISEFNRQHILERHPTIRPDKVLVRRMGVDPGADTLSSSQLSSDNRTLSMLAVGRLHPVKDHAFLLRACRLLKNREVPIKCVLAGDGPERSSIEGLIRDLDLEAEIRLVGHLSREHLDACYVRADLVVLTSRSEGIPLVLMEAMARGKPVLAPAITGIPELVLDGWNGFLYRPGSLEDFVARVELVHRSQSTLSPISRSARQHVLQHFNRERTSETSAIFFLKTLALPTHSAAPWSAQMRILYCNKYNFPFSGTEVYMFELMNLMRAEGHEVALFSMADPRGLPTPYDQYFLPNIDFKSSAHGLIARAKLAAHAVYSAEARRRLRQVIAAFRPDVAHVRNIYHHLSPSILWELKAQGIPVLYHLNDFKLLCPTYNMVAKGRVCERCRGGRFSHVFTEGCYTGPPGSALVLMAEAYFHRFLGTYQKCVDQFLAPSRFARNKLIQNGFDAQKIAVLPHFQKLPEHAPPNAAPQAPILYFGRLSPEKGVADLLLAMKHLPQVRLQVAGDGPQRLELESLARELSLKNVEFTGHVGGKVLEQLIASARFTVLPSRAYETLGKTILESYAWGRPVVASDLGSRRELIDQGETGLLFPSGNVEQLEKAISFLVERPELTTQMGISGRRFVEAQHAPEAHYQAMMRLYAQMRPWPRRAKKPAASPLSPPRPRVAFIGGRGMVSKYSGIETYYEEVGKRLVQMGHPVTVYCRSYFTPALATYEGMQLVRLPTFRSKHLETFVHTWLSTVHAMFSGCDIVHYHAQGPALFSFFPRLVGKKTVVTVQGQDWQRKKWGRVASLTLRLGELASARLPNRTMVVSQALQQRYRTAYGVQATYVPNGSMIRQRVTPSQLPEWGLEPDNYILFLGRFSPEKNCRLLIEAYETLDTNAKLVLAGGSSYTNAYVDELRRHQSEKIVFLDWVYGPALDELLTNAALFVLPSDLEGLSLALLDAMGAAICVLTSDIPENREVIADTGFTFRPGDATDLARMLQLLLSDPRARVVAGQKAQARVREHYLWPHIATQISHSYVELTDRVTALDAKIPENAMARESSRQAG